MFHFILSVGYLSSLERISGLFDKHSRNTQENLTLADMAVIRRGILKMRDRRSRKRRGDNRRNNTRIYADLDVTAYIDDQEYITKMRNISGNGIQIVEPSDIKMQPSQNCQILIQKDNTSIKLDASVVWKDFGLIGLCFKKQNQKMQKQLNHLSQTLLMVSDSDKDMTDLI